MGILLTFLACLFRYSKSKHFPKQFADIAQQIRGKEIALRILAHLFFSIAIVLFVREYGLATGLTIFLITLMFALCITVMFLPLNKKYAYLMVGLSLFFIIIENLL